MLEKIKQILLKVRYPHKHSSAAYINYLRSKGASIGENTFFFAPLTNSLDEGRIDYISIGDECAITEGVKILCHDYSWSVLRKTHGIFLPDPGKPVIIGNNVFLGWNVLVMGGVTIGNNVIVGANSIVTKDIPSNTVYAGNPAKFICTLDEFYKKRLGSRIDNAYRRAQFVYSKYKRLPTLREMQWFCVEFLSRNKGSEEFLRTLPLKTDNMDLAIKTFYNSKPGFNSYEEFITKALPDASFSKSEFESVLCVLKQEE